MEFTTDKACTTWATRSDLATVLSAAEHVLGRATIDVGANTWSLETTLLDPAVTTNKDTAPSHMEGEMPVHTVIKV